VAGTGPRKGNDLPAEIPLWLCSCRQWAGSARRPQLCYGGVPQVLASLTAEIWSNFVKFGGDSGGLERPGRCIRLVVMCMFLHFKPHTASRTAFNHRQSSVPKNQLMATGEKELPKDDPKAGGPRTANKKVQEPSQESAQTPWPKDPAGPPQDNSRGRGNRTSTGQSVCRQQQHRLLLCSAYCEVFRLTHSFLFLSLLTACMTCAFQCVTH
jgi:hypothetical protein